MIKKTLLPVLIPRRKKMPSEADVQRKHEVMRLMQRQTKHNNRESPSPPASGFYSRYMEFEFFSGGRGDRKPLLPPCNPVLFDDMRQKKAVSLSSIAVGLRKSVCRCALLTVLTSIKYSASLTKAAVMTVFNTALLRYRASLCPPKYDASYLTKSVPKGLPLSLLFVSVA